MSRHNTICVDFDDTLIPWSPINDINSTPYPGVPEAMQRLRDAGYYIVILTSRLSSQWLETSGQDELKFIMEVLNRNNIPWDKLTSEKIPAIAYFDDLAVRVTETYPLSKAVEDFLHA